MTKKVRRVKMLKGEKMIYVLLLLLVVTLPMSTVFTKAVLSETNIEVEQMKSKIDKQENINESLTMQIDELASLDKIQEVANEKGLSYNNSNIKNISQ